MNKKSTLLLFAFSVGALAGCHKHQFATTWSFNEKGHFHECECGAHDRIQPHEFGKWYTKVDATREKEGVAERKCGVCKYAETKKISKLVYKAITIEIDGRTEEVRTDSEGNYVLDIPQDEEGKYFAGFYDQSDNPFSYFGKITEDVTIHAEFSNTAPAIDSEEALERALRSAVRTAKLTTDFTITQPHYVLSSIRIIADGARTLTRHDNFDGDLFVVGITSNYKAISSVSNAVEFTLDGGEDSITLEGGLIESKGSAIFAAGASTVNLRNGVVIQNFFKTNNERVLHYNKVGDESGNISDAMKVGAAAIFSYESTINLDGAIITANQVNDDSTHEKVSSYGGAIFSCGPLNIVDAIFTNNYGSYGSCVYSLRMANVKKAVFDHNVSYNYGTFYMADSQYSNVFMNADNVDDIVFSYNQAGSSGGAIFGAIASTLQATKVKFDHNNAGSTGNGGAITTKGIISKCEDCTFDSNTCGRKGGAIYQYCAYDKDEKVYVAHTANIKNCIFENNAGCLGGAIGVGEDDDDEHPMSTNYPVFATMNIEGCTFNENDAYKDDTSYGNGGVLYAQKGAHLNVKTSTFTSNNAEKYGGVYYGTDKAVASFTESSFTSNKGTEYGGAMFITTDALNKDSSGHDIPADEQLPATTINKCHFTSNQAPSGGALFITNKSRVLINNQTTFSSNSATSNHGGAIYVKGTSNLTITNSSFNNNSATKQGGCINACDKSLTQISNSLFEYNSGKSGGVLYTVDDDTEVRFSTCTFQNNTATDKGGVLYAYTDSLVVLNGAVIKNNTATTYGGFMYQSGASTVRITDIESDNNSSGSGGFIYITTAGSNLYIYSGSTSNCSADVAANSNIYSNNASANIYIKGTDTKAYFDYDGTLFAGKGSVQEIPNA